MLVMSRRENERFIFPNLGIAVQVIKVAGKVAKIGVDAPKEIRVLREELVDEASIQELPGEFAGIGNSLPKKLKHEFRNRLNPIALGLQVAQKLIASDRAGELEEVIGRIVNELKRLDCDLIEDPGKSKRGQQLANVMERTSFDDDKFALVVDDNDNESSLLRSLLELSGYSVIVVEDGQAAIDYLHQSFRIPDFVLLDMHMPRKNGAETIAEIRSTPDFQGLKVFAVSGSDQGDVDVQVGPAGVDRWFTKPLDASQLVLEMNRVLQSA